MGHGKKYSRDSILKVLVTAKEFVIYVYHITSNDKQFSKGLRASLVQDLRSTSLDMYLTLKEANSIYPSTKEAYKKRYKLQKKARRLLFRVEAMMDIAFQIANPNNTNFWAELFTQVFKELKLWMESERKRYKGKLPSEDELHLIRKKQAALEKQRRKVKRNEDGFIIIKRK